MSTSIRLKIGEVSKQTDISVGALRYYESLGILESERGENGYRYYSPTAIQQILFIKKAQALGFSLDDISTILNIHRQGKMPCQLVQSLLQEKIDQLEAKIQQMRVFRSELEHYRDRWAVEPPQEGDICPLIETVTTIAS
ncbi:heavy metal-responsive transcriptional regulator [Leptolyngbya cf. ectocarpi LEGE 11479]|uniref:Heavy metal-responsive transcriptional regulator n=1 Tax=Leptolyngbya cf. ectocarpi LEGE 11479 TaxID=1828722 RepID=A0A928X241_LEPEC|nr:heavy metal-responsive transcriptional regulator [Leptolyngbya ectocarpi]MBE9066470.1 heavy metal-responsive transcriptional regulator [Leptolyngbya cf. ectocarpi LEGE 11479]